MQIDRQDDAALKRDAARLHEQATEMHKLSHGAAIAALLAAVFESPKSPTAGWRRFAFLSGISCVVLGLIGTAKESHAHRLLERQKTIDTQNTQR
jgi:hypothetical protein